jgi:hypothetical protein
MTKPLKPGRKTRPGPKEILHVLIARNVKMKLNLEAYKTKTPVCQIVEDQLALRYAKEKKEEAQS